MTIRVLCAAIAVLVASAGPSAAQDLPETQAPVAPIVQLDPPRVPESTDVPRQKPRTTDKKFWAVAAALNTTMLLDTKSTFDVGARCPTCYERNPVVRPFLPLGPAPVYAMGLAFDAGVMTVAAKMKGSSKPALRRTWWVVPVALTVGHAIAYRHNVGLVK